MRKPIFALALLLPLGLASQTTAGEKVEKISGHAVALDGGTLLLDGGKVRLFGVHAPEMRDWPHGAYARAALDGVLGIAFDEILGAAPVICTVIDHDRQKRPMAVCGTAGAADIGAAMIAAGWAVPHRSVTHGPDAPAGLAARYDAAEAEARVARRGLWRDTGGE